MLDKGILTYRLQHAENIPCLVLFNFLLKYIPNGQNQLEGRHWFYVFLIGNKFLSSKQLANESQLNQYFKMYVCIRPDWLKGSYVC